MSSPLFAVVPSTVYACLYNIWDVYNFLIMYGNARFMQCIFLEMPVLFSSVIVCISVVADVKGTICLHLSVPYGKGDNYVKSREKKRYERRRKRVEQEMR